MLSPLTETSLIVVLRYKVTRLSQGHNDAVRTAVLDTEFLMTVMMLVM